MKTEAAILQWLLEEHNPGVRTRALKELCGLPEEHASVKEARDSVRRTLAAAQDVSWMALKGQILVYNLTALAECGLTKDDINLEPVLARLLSQPFDANCSDLMALRAMVMLGCVDDPRVQARLEQLTPVSLPDGGWLCLHRVNKMKRVPKSCIKVNMHGLLLAGELKKRGFELAWMEPLMRYFLRRNLFYRMDDPTQLVLNLPGRRMTDVFFPSEYFHVGLPVLLDALASLGAGNATELQEAWRLLDTKRDAQGKIILEGTLPAEKSYLPRERVGAPTRWGTLYACLALKSV